ncbi:MAG: hypothetical protein RLY67_419 [Pseudomonadota bacterium]|jgi:L-seryl-tRNA(Ser) seleniumtransferase
MNPKALPGSGESSNPQANSSASQAAHLPSVDAILNWPVIAGLCESHGRSLVKRCIQTTLAQHRGPERPSEPPSQAVITAQIQASLESQIAPSLFPVINLTGTVIHTNLGRSIMGPEVIDAVSSSMGHFNALEFNLDTGERGDRDSIVEALLCRLTGAEAATVVNNCSAAVLLSLVALGARKEVIISRGEQIEIGGSFRMPDIMRAANCKLIEVGTTNRTHLRDYEQAISERSGLIVKAHRSNYAVTGFTAEVTDADLGPLAKANNLVYMVDLGSGALVDMSRFGLPREPLPSDSLRAGAELVMFSGDKLLGGPQAGILVGSRAVIARIKKHPLKRVLRISKMVMAALEATLRIYDSDHLLQERLPVLRMLTRPADEIHQTAVRVAPMLAAIAGDGFQAEVVACKSQIGSGALPEETLDSAAVCLRPVDSRKPGSLLKKTLARFRCHHPPIIGRIREDTLLFDCRCLLEEDERLLRESMSK